MTRITKRAGTLAVLALAASIGASIFAPTAQAMEPDPAPPVTYTVALDAPVKHVTLWATTTQVTPRGYHCAEVWSTVALPAFLGRACSAYSSHFPVPLTLNARTFPLGRSQIEIADGALPLMALPTTAYIDARRPSRFGRGRWEDKGRGNLYVSAPIQLYSPKLGRWVGQNRAPVAFQELTRRGWRTRVTLVSRNGLVSGTAHLGGGCRTVRLVRPPGATVWGTAGSWHTFDLLTEPLVN